MTGGRTYLSIGDVLTLLRREFPDVTISKIRFLESQGLVDPERTPSGYRKFYEHDVQRLRWVLRQQREHFLPLKVIKGRLDQESSARGGNGVDTAHAEETRGQQRKGGASQSAGSGPGGPQTTPHPVEEGPGDTEPALVGAPAGPREPLTGASAQSSQAALHPSASGGEAPLRPLAPVAGRQEREVGHPAEPLDQEPGGETMAAASGAAQRAPEPIADRQGGSARDRRGQHGAPSGRPSGEEAAGATVHRLPHDAPKTTDPGAIAGAHVSSAAEEEAQSAFAGMSMTVDELAQSCGLAPEDVRGLQSFGLISSRVIGGVAYFDEDALEVSKIAAAFARHGVEPRHLRIHLLAAQREAGFVEQIVLPLFKQRNPASRQRAHDTVSELSGLGQELRAVLLRRTLRDLLGG